MEYSTKYIDELIYLRNKARTERNWDLSDKIRTFLDSKGVFIFDELKGQIIYHRTRGSRKDVIKEIKKEQRAEKRFESWLYSMKASINSKS